MSLPIEIRLYGKVVGYIQEEPHNLTSFSFTREYLSLEDRPVLGQRFEDSPSRIVRSKKNHLPWFFANLVPEQGGPLAEMIARQHGFDPSDEAALLSSLGRDLPGAVEAYPVENTPREPRPVNVSSALTDMTVDEDSGLFRFSLGGVQLKFSVVQDNDRLTLPVHGVGGNWILKIPSADFQGLSENKWTVMEWARNAGFDVPKCMLVHPHNIRGIQQDVLPEDTLLFAIKRYDREGTKRVHQEDFAQVVGLLPMHKYDHVSYENMASFSRALLGYEGCIEFVKRLIFMIASGNADAHLKNWSLLYRDQSSPTWSPLYDQVAVVAWPKYARTFALNLSRNKRFAAITMEHFFSLGKLAQLEREKVETLVTETIVCLRDIWRARQSNWPMLPEHRLAVEEHWRRVPLLSDTCDI